MRGVHVSGRIPLWAWRLRDFFLSIWKTHRKRCTSRSRRIGVSLQGGVSEECTRRAEVPTATPSPPSLTTGIRIDSVSIVPWELSVDIVTLILRSSSRRDVARFCSVASTWRDAGKSLATARALALDRSWRSKVVQPEIIEAIHGHPGFWCAARKDALIVCGGFQGVVFCRTDVTPRAWTRVDDSHTACVKFVGGLLWVGQHRTFDDGVLLLWDLEANHFFAYVDAHKTCVTCIEELRGSVATGGVDGLIKLWGKHDRVLRHVLKGHEKAVHALSSSNREEEWLISGSADATIRVWNVEDATCINVFHTPYGKIAKAFVLGESPIVSVLSGDRSALSRDRKAFYLDLRDGHCEEIMSEIDHMDFSNGKLVLCRERHNNVIVWDVEKKVCVRKLEVEREVEAVWCDEEMILGMQRGYVACWDFATSV